MIKALDYLKRKNSSSNNSILNDKEVTLINNVIKRTEVLVKVITKCVGDTTPEIVINKVSQIMSFNPELIPEKADIVLEATKKGIHSELKNFPEITEVKYYTTKEDKTTTINFVCVCDCTYITDMDLANLSEIMEDLRNTFAEKKMLFNYLIVADSKKESYKKEESELHEKACRNSSTCDAEECTKILKRKLKKVRDNPTINAFPRQQDAVR